MSKLLKLILIFILGIVIGLLIHGVLEIIAIWILINWLTGLFLRISWPVWLWIHVVFTVLTEILGVILAFWIVKNLSNKKSSKG